MSVEVADLYVTLRSISDPFSKGLKNAAADAESSSKRMTGALATVAKIGAGVAVGLTGIAVESVKMASTFNAQMTLLGTQAGVGKNQIAGLSSGVLALAGQVGFSPTSLAEALFHVESSFASVGISGPQALSLLKIAAEGAAVGNANLVDVTNALDSAVVSGIPGVQDMSQAMGVLNATVGAGDMTMQDLADAFSTGLLATVKGYGLTFKDVGAGLAVFGDNNIRGAVAATDLRMAVQAMAVPASTAGAELRKLGLTSTTLARDMQSGGMLKALDDLKTRMTAAGVTSKQQGEVITQLFGKKAGTGLNVLIDQLDRVKSKYPDLTKGATGFADAWATTKATFAQQVKEIGAEADALGIRLGQFLIPQLSKLITLGQTDIGQAVSGFTGKDHPAPTHPGMGNAFLNKEFTAPPDVTGWQRFGEEVRRVLGDVEQGGKRLEPVAADFARFGDDVWQALGKIEHVAAPVAHDLGVGLFLGAQTVGKVFANVLGPAIKDVAEFIDDHQTTFRIFTDVVLGGMALKMGVLGGINATKGLIDLATKIVQFPVGQVGEITTAWGGMKAAWAGKEAAQGEQAVVGLTGALGNLRGSVSGMLDKFSFLDTVRLKLMGVRDGVTEVEQAAAQTTGLATAATAETNVATEAATAAGAAGGLLGTLGKFALAGGVVGGSLLALGALGTALDHLHGNADATALTLDDITRRLGDAATGATATGAQLAQQAATWIGVADKFKQPDAVQGVKNLDAALAQLVTSGQGPAAAQEFDAIAAAMANSGQDASGAAGHFPAYEKALHDTAAAAQTTDGQLQGMQNTLAAQESLTAYGDDLAMLKQQLQSSGNAMTNTSDAGRENQRMFEALAGDVLTYYQNQRAAGKGTADATNDMVGQVKQIEALGNEFGISKGKVDQFLGSLAGIKPEYATKLTVHVDTSALTGFYQQLNEVSKFGGSAKFGFDDGGFITGGAKGAPKLILAHVGEYVVSNDMQAGRAPIDPQVLSGVGAGTSRSAGGGSAGGTVVYNVMNVSIAGSLVSEDRALSKLRAAQLQWSRRNGGTGWAATR